MSQSHACEGVAKVAAGLAYNSFPTMAGQWIPEGLFAYAPLWRNFFENVTTVQFDHRVLATLLTALIITFWWSTRHISSPPRLRIGLNLLLAAMCLQVGLGIATLLLVVPTALAGQMADAFRALSEQTDEPEFTAVELVARLRASQEHASELERGLALGDPLVAQSAWRRVVMSCTGCHARYRDD